MAKKMIAFVLSVAMVFTALSSFAFATDVTNNDEYTILTGM